MGHTGDSRSSLVSPSGPFAHMLLLHWAADVAWLVDRQAENHIKCQQEGARSPQTDGFDHRGGCIAP